MIHGLLNQSRLEHLVYVALDTSDDLVLVLEQRAAGLAGWVIAAANEAFCRASGHAHGDLVGRALQVLAAPGAEARDWDAAVQAAHDGRSYRTELQCVREDGTVLWLGMHVMPVPGERRPCSVVLARDITQNRRDRQQQAAVQGLLAKVFVAVQAPVCIVDDRNAIMMVNPACEHLLGYASGKLAGTTALNLIAPAERERLRAIRERHLATGESYQCDTRLMHADGSEIPVSLASTIVERDDLKRFRIISCMRLADAVPPSCRVHVAGRIRMIGLEEIKASLGARWPELAQRVMASAEHVIRRRCGPRDTWTRTRDSAFIISFAEATEDEAALQAAAIAREIRNRLIGEGETPEASEVSAIAKAVSLPGEPPPTGDLLASALDDRLKSHLAAIEEQARRTLADAVTTVRCDLRPVHSTYSRKLAGYFASLSLADERRLLCAYSALPSNERVHFDLDRLMLGVAADQAITKMGQGSDVPVYVGVEFTVFLDRRGMQRYLDLCGKLDPRLREQLILVITNLPHGVPRSRVLECTTRLRPFCRSVAFEADHFEPPPVEPGTLHASVVVVNDLLSTHWGSDDLSGLERLLSLVHAQAGRVLVRGTSSLDRGRRLKAAGVDLICFAAP